MGLICRELCGDGRFWRGNGSAGGNPWRMTRSRTAWRPAACLASTCCGNRPLSAAGVSPRCSGAVLRVNVRGAWCDDRALIEGRRRMLRRRRPAGASTGSDFRPMCVKHGFRWHRWAWRSRGRVSSVVGADGVDRSGVGTASPPPPRGLEGRRRPGPGGPWLSGAAAPEDRIRAWFPIAMGYRRTEMKRDG